MLKFQLHSAEARNDRGKSYSRSATVLTKAQTIHAKASAYHDLSHIIFKVAYSTLKRIQRILFLCPRAASTAYNFDRQDSDPLGPARQSSLVE
jgi:hypothetical protein